MPPYFPYLLALFAYAVFAGCGLLIAVGLAIFRQTRPIAKRLAAGICGSFPGVFLFQALALPPVALLLLTMFVTHQIFHPPNRWGDLFLFGFILLIFGTFAIASLLGFYTGFRTAWEFAAGRSVHLFLERDRILGPLLRIVRRVQKILPR